VIQRRIVERTLVDVRRGRLGQPTESCVSDLRRKTVLAEWRNVSAAKIVLHEISTRCDEQVKDTGWNRQGKSQQLKDAKETRDAKERTLADVADSSTGTADLL
jgi:hypothetical protein